MEKVIKGFKIAGKISEVILAISIIGDLVGKYSRKVCTKSVVSEVGSEIVSTENNK